MLERIAGGLQQLGGLLLGWREQGSLTSRWQGTQLKAEADVRAHEFLCEVLHRLTPDTPVLSEEDESGHRTERPTAYWLIDPIDGTASYCGGYDGFVTQVALMQGQRPVLSVVHAPALGLTYTAMADGIAACNGTRLTRTGTGDCAPILIDNYPEPRGIARAAYAGLKCAGYVESGSIGLKICRVADGTADLFIKDVPVRDWDLAPADLILARAGGLLLGLDGHAPQYTASFEKVGVIAAANRVLIEQVLRWRKAQIGNPE